jgi:hypothetical protein
MFGVPYINPISETNREGTEVEPDVKVDAADALSTAEKLAGERTKSKQRIHLHRFNSIFRDELGSIPFGSALAG